MTSLHAAGLVWGHVGPLGRGSLVCWRAASPWRPDPGDVRLLCDPAEWAGGPSTA